MNTRVCPDQAAPRWCPDTHATQAERLLAHVWDTIRRGDRTWDDPDIAALLSAAEVHMLLAHTPAPPTGPTRPTTPTGDSYV